MSSCMGPLNASLEKWISISWGLLCQRTWGNPRRSLGQRFLQRPFWRTWTRKMLMEKQVASLVMEPKFIRNWRHIWRSWTDQSAMPMENLKERIDCMAAKSVCTRVGLTKLGKTWKKNIPNSISTRRKGKPNPLLWTYATQWQWRWENIACANLSRLTAETLRANKRWRCCERE